MPYTDYLKIDYMYKSKILKYKFQMSTQGKICDLGFEDNFLDTITKALIWILLEQKQQQQSFENETGEKHC